MMIKHKKIIFSTSSDHVSFRKEITAFMFRDHCILYKEYVLVLPHIDTGMQKFTYHDEYRYGLQLVYHPMQYLLMFLIPLCLGKKTVKETTSQC